MLDRLAALKFNFIAGAILVLLHSGCTDFSKVDLQLPKTAELGSYEGFLRIRSILHFHSPYSYDACDYKGLSNGLLNGECLEHLKNAFCKNKIDVGFFSDHPNHMADFAFEKLLLPSYGGKILTNHQDQEIAQLFNPCGDDFKALIVPGLEGRLLGLGMESHLTPTDLPSGVDSVKSFYGEFSPRLARALESVASIVIIPHTEQYSIEKIVEIEPTGIEIYNIHANLDPKIRQKDLNSQPFIHVASLLHYLLDFSKEMVPDTAFLDFLEIPDFYFKKWNALLARGLRIGGFGGSDSHENIFPYSASDGERLDSHRRMTRFMSNHLLVKGSSLEDFKEAIQKSRSFVLFEGFGSAQNFDFFGVNQQDNADVRVNVGDVFSLGSSPSFVLKGKAPSIHSQNLGFEDAKFSPVELSVLRIPFRQDHGSTLMTSPENFNLSDLQTEVFHAKGYANGSGLDFEIPCGEPGAYRVEIRIQPMHLKVFLEHPEKAQESFLWIVSNPIYVQP